MDFKTALALSILGYFTTEELQEEGRRVTEKHSRSAEFQAFLSATYEKEYQFQKHIRVLAKELNLTAPLHREGTHEVDFFRCMVHLCKESMAGRLDFEVLVNAAEICYVNTNDPQMSMEADHFCQSIGVFRHLAHDLRILHAKGGDSESVSDRSEWERWRLRVSAEAHKFLEDTIELPEPLYINPTEEETLDGILSGRDLDPLRELELRNLKLKNLARLKPCSDLESLYLIDGRIDELGPISELSSLRKLYLDRIEGFEDLRALSGSSSLKEITLSSCKNLKTLSGLENLANLMSLTVIFCPEFEDTTGIQAFPLEHINIQECPRMTEVPSLRSKKWLKHINLCNCPVSFDDIKEIRRGIPHCRIYFTRKRLFGKSKIHTWNPGADKPEARLR